MTASITHCQDGCNLGAAIDMGADHPINGVGVRAASATPIGLRWRRRPLGIAVTPHCTHTSCCTRLWAETGALGHAVLAGRRGRGDPASGASFPPGQRERRWPPRETLIAMVFPLSLSTHPHLLFQLTRACCCSGCWHCGSGFCRMSPHEHAAEQWSSPR